MTERATARHRADVRPSTPLTGLTTTISAAVGDHAGVLGRGGVALAVSTGLITAVGLPAQASTRTGGDAARTASVPLLPEVAASPVLAAGADALAAAPVTAPAQAKVTFEHSAFKALPQHGAPATPAGASRDSPRSRAPWSGRPTRRRSPRPCTARRPPPRPAVPAAPRRAVPAGVSAPAGSVVAIAMRYLGVPYVYGGSTPRGFDCSGFTQYVFAQVGITLARSADGQYRSVTRITRSQAVAGDLVFYLGGGGAYHVGIYLGGTA